MTHLTHSSKETGAQKSLVQQRFGAQASAYATSSILSDRGNLDTICRMAEISNRDRILDVATGTGFLADAFVAAGAEVVATDLTLPMLLLARDMIGPGKISVSFALADVDRLPFADGAFDVVSCRVAFHHFSNPQKAVAEMARACQPHGRIVFMDIIASEDGRKYERQNAIEKLRDPSHVRHHQRSGLQRMLAECGLKVVRDAIWHYRWNFEEWISLTGAGEAERRQIRRMMVDSIDGDKAGLQVELEGENLFFTYTALIMVIAKLGKVPD